MKVNFVVKRNIAFWISLWTIVFSIGIFATDAAIYLDTAATTQTDGATTDEEVSPKQTVVTEYGVEVTVTSTKGEYAANEIPNISLSVRNINDYSLRNLVAKANLPSALSYVGSTKAIIHIPDMQAGRSQTVDFQLKRTASSGGGGGSVNTANSNSSDILMYILLVLASVIFIGAIVFAVLIGRNKKNNSKFLALFLCFGLAMQCFTVATDARVDSGSFNVIHKIKYNNVEYGINISVSFGESSNTDSSFDTDVESDTQDLPLQPTDTDNANDTQDSPNTAPPSDTNNGSDAQGWEQLRILDFSSNVSDVLVNESVNAKFSAVVLSSERITNQTLELYEGDKFVAKLKDDGKNGDTTANDGVFTASVALSSNTVKNTEYYASYGEMKSDPVEICFYEEIEAESFDVFQSILDAINVMDDYTDVMSYLASCEYVTAHYYDAENESVTFMTNLGMTGVWSKDDAGMKHDSAFSDSDIKFISQITENLAGTTYNIPNKKIAVLRPYRSTDFKYDDFLTLATATANSVGGTVEEFRDANVTLEVMEKLDSYGIVLIDSHGDLILTNTDERKPYIHIGQDFKAFTDGFSADFYSGRITVSKNGKISVNADFFENRYKADDFKNTLFFLGTCYSMYDESISNALISCGAGAVFGYTSAVTTGYCNETLKVSLQTNLLDKKNTVSEAYMSALETCGTTDPDVHGCRFVYDGNENYSYVSQYGTIKGNVKSAQGDSYVGWTRISMIGDNGSKYTFVQNDKMFTKDVEAGTYTVIISAYGHLSRALSNVVIENGKITYIEETLLLDGANSTEETEIIVKGKIINVMDGKAVAGAKVKFIPCHGGIVGDAYVTDNSGNIITLTTDSNGLFSTMDLVKGYYTAEVTAEGFVVEYSNITASDSDAIQEIAITPELQTADNLRIILTWNDRPRDIDSHVEGRWSQTEYFHVYFANRNAYRGDETVANLDLDDMDGFGPETVTLTVDPTADYIYYVDNFSGEAPLSTSGAQVRVYQGNSLLEVYNVPVENVSGGIWRVFNIDQGRIVSVNQITN